MMESGNMYWAIAKAALYAAACVFLSTCIDGCVERQIVHDHNCRVKWAKRRAELEAAYETNVVVKAVKVGDGRWYNDINSTKLLLYREADVRFGQGNYDLKYADFEPCKKHGGETRIYYTAKRKEKTGG